ncbi:Mu-like prophage major head subunit gpT family protein [Desulfovulcanus sp.]
MLINAETLRGLFINFKTVFNQTLDETNTFWEKVATRVPSTTRSNAYGWLGSFPNLREWIGERQVQNLSAHDYEIKNKSFELTVGVDRDDIEDDNIGVYKPIIQELARSAKTHPDKLVFGELFLNGFSLKCYDGKPFFSDAHKVGKQTFSNLQTGSNPPWFLLDTTRALKPFIVQIRKRPEFVSLDNIDDWNVFSKKQYLYGVDYRGNVGFGFWQQAYASKAELTFENYALARKKMQSLKNEHGNPLAIIPNLLVVGPSNEEKARTILNAELINGGETNIWRNSADLLVVPWLE